MTQNSGAYLRIRKVNMRKKNVDMSRRGPSVLRRITLIAATVITSATLLPGSASASDLPPANVPGTTGITVNWSGTYVGYQRMEDITLQVCDASPWDKNKATVRIQAYLAETGIANTPTMFQVPQGDAKCKVWRDVFLTYHREHLAFVRASIYGSEAQEKIGYGKWYKNPFQVP